MLVAELSRSLWCSALPECPLDPRPALREAGPAGAPRLRLLDRVREAIRARHSHFLTSLAVEGKVAASTQNQALGAVLFLYRERSVAIADTS